MNTSIKQSKVKARIKVVFCDDTVAYVDGPKLSAKQVKKAPKQLNKQWAKQPEEMLTAGDMWDKEDRPAGVSAKVHPVTMSMETRATKHDDWIEVWAGEKTPCSHLMRSLDTSLIEEEVRIMHKVLEDHRLPILVTEIHRYSEPEDAFGFHVIEPDTTGTWSIQPFTSEYYADDYDEDSPTYREVSRDLYYGETIEERRKALELDGYKPVDFIDLPAHFQYYVIHYQAPLEWHGRLDNRDPELMARVKVWVLGNLPA